MQSINPASGDVLQSYAPVSDAEALAAAEAAHEAFSDWRDVGFEARAALMQRAAAVLEDECERYARLISDEMGKVLTEARSEVEKCAWVCRYYAERAHEFLADEPVETDAAESFVSFQPIGVVLAVMPWNFPFWQVFRFAAPALMAGNVALLKHASNVPGCSLMIEEVFEKAGFPPNVFRSLLISSSQVAALIELPIVRAVTLTGSTNAGKAVAEKAGAFMKKTVLELGGSDAYLILEDADLEAASEICVKSRMINAGQSCIAAKRFIVVEAVHDEFLRRVKERMAALKMGDPLDESVDLGPQARVDLRDELHQQVVASVSAGAKLWLGGEVPEQAGAWYPPTLLADVVPGMPAYDEELFGPVAAVIKVKDEAEAIEVANSTVFGLGAAVFTRDEARGRLIAREKLDAGACFVNSFVASDPRLPFGGVKDSGYGRELSWFGIREFVNIKAVSVGT